MNEKSLPSSARRTLDRRKWMNWVGKSAVLSLAGGVLTRCVDPEQSGFGDGRSTDVTSAPDAGGGSSDTGPYDSAICATEAINFPYAPMDLNSALGDRWPVRTVDKQNLEWILKNWRLQVDGMVSKPVTLDFDDILSLPRQDQISDFHCVEGWSVYDIPWNGIHTNTLIDLVTPDNSATHITFHTIDGKYNESLPIAVAKEPMTLLAYGVDCNTIPLSHGFPVRLVVPRLLAYKSAKYVTRVEFTDHPVSGYWVAFGYPYDGIVPENRLRPGKY